MGYRLGMKTTTARSFKVVDMRGKRLAGPFAMYAQAIEWSRQIRDVGVICNVKEVK